jgi:putative ABC transport system permease protein
MIFGAVGLVLLIACANVSGLMLARSTARRKEVTVRLALGSSRSRLMLQFLFEGLLLSVVAAICGLALGQWIVDGVFHLLTKTSFTTLVSLQDEVHLNGTVIIFTVGISLLTGILFTLVPAAGSIRITIADSLREARASTRSEHRLHKTLVLLELACAVVLVAGASLLMQSFAHMQHVEYGYDPHGLAMMTMPIPQQNRSVFTDEVLARIKATPGVESAAVTSYISFGGLSLPFNIEGDPLPGGDTPARYSSVTADYFRVLKARLITGREFNVDDSPNAPPVAIINETLAHQYFRGGSPIGRRLVVANLNRRVVCEIVGVVADIRQDEPLQPIQPEILVHWSQLPWIGPVLVFRTSIDPSNTAKTIQTTIASLDKTLPKPTVRTLDSILADQVAEPRLYLVLLGAFAIVALLLSLIGIYGLLSYIVNQRLHDMAIRIAIGARSRDVLQVVIGEAMRLCIAGIAFGLISASVLTRMLEHWLFGVKSTDPATFATVALLLLSVALSACIIPARRATKADPVSALRHE